MNQTQRIIKYFALAFAFVLIVNIFLAIVYTFNIISNVSEEENKTEMSDLKINTAAIIDIDISTTDLYIKKGSTLKAETNNEEITIKQKNNQLSIKEKNHSWVNFDNKNKLTIYVPEKHLYDEVSIKLGTGSLKIDNLVTEKLYLDLGTGKATIDKLTVTNNTNIESGVGKLNIASSSLANLDLNMGVGKITMTSKITGDSKIDSGIGKIELNLIGKKSDYQIIVDKGIGTIKLADEKTESNQNYGTGNNKISITGGIGTTKINFK